MMRFLLRELFEFRFIQSDPNFANFLLLPDGRLGLLDLGAARDVSKGISRGYANLCRAAIDEDRSGLERAALEVGFLADTEDQNLVRAFVDLLWLASEPLREQAPYDFGATDLPGRTREASFGMLYRHGFIRPPPAETLFLQRKLGGTFLLCARLRARVDLQELLEAALSREAR